MSSIEKYIAIKKNIKSYAPYNNEQVVADELFEGDSGIDIKLIGKAIWFHRGLFATIVLVLATIFVFGNDYIFPNQYTAVASVRVKSVGIDDREEYTRRFEVLPGEILSNRVLEQVIDDLGLAKRKNISFVERILMNFNIAPKLDIKSNILQWLQHDVIIIQESIGETYTALFKIKLVNEDGEMAVKIVNAIADTYIKVNQEITTQDNAETVRFLTEKIRVSEQTMKATAKKLTDFQVNNADYLIPTTSLTREIEMLQTEHKDSSIRIDQLKELKKRLRQAMSEESRYITTVLPGTNMERGMANSIDGELHLLKVELASVESKYTSEHPMIRELQEKIRSLQSTIDQSERPDVLGSSNRQSNPEYVSLKHELNTIEAERIALKRRIPEIKQKMKELNEKLIKTISLQQTIRALEHDRDIAYNDYRVLNDEYITHNLKAEANASNIGNDFSVLDYANIPVLSSPPRRTLMIFGIGFALAISLFVVLVISKFHNWKFHIDHESKGTNPILAIISNVIGVLWFSMIAGYVIMIPYL